MHPASCLWLAAALYALPATAQNLLPNSSFEEGDIGWQLWHGDPAVSRGGVSQEGPCRGRRCYKVENPGDKGANLHSDPIPCRPDTDYTLTTYVRSVGGSGLRLAAWGLDAAGKTLSYEIGGAQFVPGDQPGYARIFKSFHTPADCTQLKAHLICNGGTVWWDAVQLEQARHFTPYVDGPPLGEEARRALPANGLPNSGFESGDVRWTLWHQDAAVSSGAVEPGERHEGGAAFHVYNPGNGGANLFSASVPCKPGTVYTVSAWVKVKGGRGVQLAGWALDRQEQTLSYAVDGAAPLPPDVPTFQRFTKTFTTPADASLLRAHLICNGGEVWWDAVQLEEGDHSTPYAPGPQIDNDPAEGNAEALAYTRAMIAEARLQDALRQARRLCTYKAEYPAAQGAREVVRIAEGLVAAVSVALGASHLVPQFRTIDYEAVARDTAAAQEALQEVWQRLQVEPAVGFGQWAPSAEGLDQPGRLAGELLIFPCFTSDRFFRPDANWDILRPFGFRLVSGWWGPTVDRQGTPSFSAMDRIIATCARHGYKVDLTVSNAPGVAWLQDRLPAGEIFLKTAGGDWSPAGNCHDTLDIWHPRVVQESARFLAAVGEHYAPDPRVVSYELVNEPSLSIEKRVHGYEYRRIGVGGYGPQARAEWTRWLRRKYGTIEELNRLWRSEYASFEQAEPPTDLTPPTPIFSEQPVATGALLDFQSFRNQSHAEHFRGLVDAVKAGDARKPVMSQFVLGFGIRTDAACDLLQLACTPDWDFLGTHDWPGHKPAVDSVFAYSMRRYCWRPHWEDEFIWSQWEPKPTPEPQMRAAAERNLWRQIAWGKQGISLFNLETEWLHDSPHSWNNSLISIESDYEIPRYSTGAVPVVERKANLVKEAIVGAKLVSQRVGVLLPTASVLAGAPEGRAQRLGRQVTGWLLERHVTPFVIPEECVVDGREDLGGCDLLIAPWAVNADEALQRKLLAWLEAGGSLLCLGPIGLYDAYGAPSGALLERCFGHRSWTYDPEAVLWAATPDLAEGVAAAEVGKGRVGLLADPGKDGQHVESAVAEALARAVPVLPVATELPSVELLPAEARDGRRLLWAVNLDIVEARRGAVVLGGRWPRVRELTVEGAPAVPVTCGESTTTLQVELAPGEGLLFELGE